MVTRFAFSHIALQDRESLRRHRHSVSAAKQASVLFDELVFERRLSVLEDSPSGRTMRWVGASEAKRRKAEGAVVMEDASTSDIFDDDAEVLGSGHGSWNNLHRWLSARGFDWSTEVVGEPVTATTTSRSGILAEVSAVADAYEAALYKPVAGARVYGATALAIVVPDLSSVPWEALAEFRSHPASHEARHALRDFEWEAQKRGFEPSDAAGFERRVAQDVTSALLAAWSETRPRLGLDVVKEAVKTGVGLIPIAGAAVTAAASVGESVAKARAHDRSWLSALCSLAGAAS